jgi:nucleotide-binding universal stress UspA family protein
VTGPVDVERAVRDLGGMTPSLSRASAAAPVIVGVDGSSGSVAALRHGARIAKTRGAQLLAVTAWDSPPLSTSEPGDADEAQRVLEAAAHEVFGTRLPGWLRTSVVRGPARTVLRDASLGGQLLIVGEQGRGGVEHGAGFVSSMMAVGSACPALIFHSTARRPTARER